MSTLQKLFVRTIGEVRQGFVLLAGACWLALVLPAFPRIQAAAIEDLFRALDVVFDVIVQKIYN